MPAPNPIAIPKTIIDAIICIVRAKSGALALKLSA